MLLSWNKVQRGAACTPTKCKSGLFICTFFALAQVHGQESGRPDLPESAGSSALRGILEVDCRSGAASLYIPLGPGVGTPPVRYLPALVGRFAPQTGVRHQTGAPGGPILEPTLLAATGFELDPGHLDLPLAPPGTGWNGNGARWTYPDGTGGSACLASASTIDPAPILSRFGHFWKRVVSPRPAAGAGGEVFAGAGGDWLLFLDEESGQPDPLKAGESPGGRPAKDPVPPGALAIRGDVAYEYEYTETWGRASGAGPRFAHYRLKAVRASTGQECQFTYGSNGVDYLAVCGNECVRVALGALTGVPPAAAVDAGLPPDTAGFPHLSPANVAVQIRVTYRGLGLAPGYEVWAVTHPECLTPNGLTGACPGALGKGGPDLESFRRNLQVTMLQREEVGEAIRFGYAPASPVEWSGEGGTRAFAPTVLSDILLPGRNLHLDWGACEAAAAPGLGARDAAPAWSYGVDTVSDQWSDGERLEWVRSAVDHGIAGQTPANLVPGHDRPGEQNPAEPLPANEGSGRLRLPVTQARHFALCGLPCRTFLRARWELRAGPGAGSGTQPLAAGSGVPYREGEDIPTFELDSLDRTLFPVAGQLTRWIESDNIPEVHNRPWTARRGLLGGGGGASKGSGAGGASGRGDAPSGQSLAAIRAYDRSHSKPGGPPTGPQARADAIHHWVNEAAERGVFDSTQGIKDQAGFSAYIGEADTSKMSYADFRNKYADFLTANTIGRMAGEAMLGAAFATTITNESPGKVEISISDKFSREAKGLMDQMAMDAAKRGAGDMIMPTLSDPAFAGMEKFSYTVISDAGLVSEVHYVRNPKTGELMDFKFKRHAGE